MKKTFLKRTQSILAIFIFTMLLISSDDDELDSWYLVNCNEINPVELSHTFEVYIKNKDNDLPLHKAVVELKIEHWRVVNRHPISGSLGCEGEYELKYEGTEELETNTAGYASVTLPSFLYETEEDHTKINVHVRGALSGVNRSVNKHYNLRWDKLGYTLNVDL